MKLVITAFTLIIFASNMMATAQQADILIYKGKTHRLFTNPLGLYLNNQNSKLRDIFRASCTANWRGYVATWEIKKEGLYLVKLVEGTCNRNAPEIPISTIFPNQKSPIKASWFSGTLRVPFGKMLQYVHGGYASTYEKKLIFTIKNGKVISEKVVDNVKKNNISHIKNYEK